MLTTQLPPDELSVRVAAARAAIAAGDAEAAIDHAIAAARLWPESSTCFELLARAVRAMALPSAELASAAVAMEQDRGEEPRFLELLARAALATGRRDRARAATDLLAAIVDETAAGCGRLALLYTAAGALDVAAVHTVRALELDGQLAEAWIAAGLLTAGRKREV